MSQHTVTLRVTSLPPYHSSGSSLYLAGSFNGWNPQDEQYKMIPAASGGYSIQLSLDKGKYEYKITRGGWDKVECAKDGAAITNRVLDVEASHDELLQIAEWQDRFQSAVKKSTASTNVCIIDTAFLVPQLNRTRRVWIYLPPAYCDGSKKKYPVLYMQDGQNVFDESTSYSGEWGVDEYMDSVRSGNCIVVGIDHGSDKRMTEYNPYDHTRFGKGEGDRYADFIVKTVKPFIDKHYRTLKGRKTTYIAGSSMGGLISMYTLLKYPAVFGGAGVFSPSFWITDNRIYEDIRAKGAAVQARIYFYAGKLEGESMVPNMLKAFESMAGVSTSVMTTVIRDDGKHNEATWRKEFPLFYQWVSQMSQN